MKPTKLNVLIVENNRFLVNILCQTMASEFNIAVAANGFEAMALLERGISVDFMVTDLKLPKFDGIELIQQIRKSVRYQALPILALSDSGDSLTRIHCLENGADDCMAKPFNPFEIQAKIRAMARRSVTGNHKKISISNTLFPGSYTLNLN